MCNARRVNDSRTPEPPKRQSGNGESSQGQTEIESGQRFAFGDNWARFLGVLDEGRIASAEDNLKQMLDLDRLDGKNLVDIGSGSGIMSLAARRLGASVVSFDYDAQSVACTAELRSRYFPEDEDWTVMQGSVLDEEFLESLGQFDVVLSWGVLHHTGDMWRAMNLVANSVAAKGQLFVALYNDQGRQSRMWWWVKKAYVSSSPLGRLFILAPAYLRLWGPTTIRDLTRMRPFATWRSYKSNRGMSPHYDVIDWVGGFPFEVASPQQVINFYSSRGFRLSASKDCGNGLGCNEFVFGRGR